MQLSYEIPTKYLSQLGQHLDFNFCLAHLALKDSAYISYYKNSPKFKICDNSAFELGKPMPAAEVVKAAKFLNANEVICPDSLRNGRETIETTTEFINYLKMNGEMGKFQLMGVVQGCNALDWYECFDFMVKSPDINTVGINYLSCGIFGSDPMASRISAVQSALIIHRVTKPIHLLGMGGNPLELKFYKPGTIRSCDTSMPVVQGLNRNRFDEVSGLVGPKLPRPDNFFELALDKQQIEDIIYNVGLLRKWATEGLVNV